MTREIVTVLQFDNFDSARKNFLKKMIEVVKLLRICTFKLLTTLIPRKNHRKKKMIEKKNREIIAVLQFGSFDNFD